MEKGAQSAPGAPLPLAFNLLALSTCDVTVCGASPVPSCLSSPDRCRGGSGPGALSARCSADLRTLGAPVPRLPQSQERGGVLREGAAPSLHWPAATALARSARAGEVGGRRG